MKDPKINHFQFAGALADKVVVTPNGSTIRFTGGAHDPMRSLSAFELQGGGSVKVEISLTVVPHVEPDRPRKRTQD